MRVGRLLRSGNRSTTSVSPASRSCSSRCTSHSFCSFGSSSRQMIASTLRPSYDLRILYGSMHVYTSDVSPAPSPAPSRSFYGTPVHSPSLCLVH
ncbi:hypothetical protein LINPERPRIM_LOCUS20358 [Linum perenne]